MTNLEYEDYCDNCSREVGRGVLYNGVFVCQRCHKDLKKQDRKEENVRRKREEKNEDYRF